MHLNLKGGVGIVFFSSHVSSQIFQSATLTFLTSLAAVLSAPLYLNLQLLQEETGS